MVYESRVIDNRSSSDSSSGGYTGGGGQNQKYRVTGLELLKPTHLPSYQPWSDPLMSCDNVSPGVSA